MQTATMSTRDLVRLVTTRRTCTHPALRTVLRRDLDAIAIVCDDCQRRSEWIDRFQAANLRLPIEHAVDLS